MALRPIYKQHHLKPETKEVDPDVPPEVEKKDSKVVYGVFVVLVILGITTGYLLSRGGPTSKTGTTETSATGTTPGSKAVGSSDSQTFKDFAEGTLGKGGLGAEGTHNLVRDGGPSQTVYLISSVVDLDLFDGKKVKVWGQTMAAKKAPWLMDVGKVEAE
jgi:hypothetical protein